MVTMMTLDELRERGRQRRARQKKIKALTLCPFSGKQRRALTWWKTSGYSAADGVIADGAVRSGKTVALSLGFVLWAMKSYD